MAWQAILDTYMARGIVAHERKSTGDESDAESYAWARPNSRIGCGSKNKVGTVLWTQIDERYQDCEEPNDMPDKPVLQLAMCL